MPFLQGSPHLRSPSHLSHCNPVQESSTALGLGGFLSIRLSLQKQLLPSPSRHVPAFLQHCSFCLTRDVCYETLSMHGQPGGSLPYWRVSHASGTRSSLQASPPPNPLTKLPNYTVPITGFRCVIAEALGECSVHLKQSEPWSRSANTLGAGRRWLRSVTAHLGHSAQRAARVNALQRYLPRCSAWYRAHTRHPGRTTNTRQSRFPQLCSRTGPLVDL